MPTALAPPTGPQGRRSGGRGEAAAAAAADARAASGPAAGAGAAPPFPASSGLLAGSGGAGALPRRAGFASSLGLAAAGLFPAGGAAAVFPGGAAGCRRAPTLLPTTRSSYSPPLLQPLRPQPHQPQAAPNVPPPGGGYHALRGLQYLSRPYAQQKQQLQNHQLPHNQQLLLQNQQQHRQQLQMPNQHRPQQLLPNQQRQQLLLLPNHQQQQQQPLCSSLANPFLPRNYRYQQTPPIAGLAAPFWRQADLQALDQMLGIANVDELTRGFRPGPLQHTDVPASVNPMDLLKDQSVVRARAEKLPVGPLVFSRDRGVISDENARDNRAAAAGTGTGADAAAAAALGGQKTSSAAKATPDEATHRKTPSAPKSTAGGGKINPTESSVPKKTPDSEVRQKSTSPLKTTPGADTHLKTVPKTAPGAGSQSGAAAAKPSPPAPPTFGDDGKTRDAPAPAGNGPANGILPEQGKDVLKNQKRKSSKNHDDPDETDSERESSALAESVNSQDTVRPQTKPKARFAPTRMMWPTGLQTSSMKLPRPVRKARPPPDAGVGPAVAGEADAGPAQGPETTDVLCVDDVVGFRGTDGREYHARVKGFMSGTLATDDAGHKDAVVAVKKTQPGQPETGARGLATEEDVDMDAPDRRLPDGIGATSGGGGTDTSAKVGNTDDREVLGSAAPRSSVRLLGEVAAEAQNQGPREGSAGNGTLEGRTGNGTLDGRNSETGKSQGAANADDDEVYVWLDWLMPKP
ncbi:MAG: hypothetical protein BJ554DRAFT_3033, partial [Olpidium bornovanus]